MSKRPLAEVLSEIAASPIPEREFSRLETELLSYVKRRHRHKAGAILMTLGLRLGALETEQDMKKMLERLDDGSINKNV